MWPTTNILSLLNNTGTVYKDTKLDKVPDKMKIGDCFVLMNLVSSCNYTFFSSAWRLGSYEMAEQVKKLSIYSYLYLKLE